MTEKIRYPQVEKSLREDITRSGARVTLFRAFQEHIGPDNAQQRRNAVVAALGVYKRNQAAIVPESVTNAALHHQEDPEKARKEELKRIFLKDVRIAERFEEGVTIGERTVYLKDLINDELTAIATKTKALH